MHVVAYVFVDFFSMSEPVPSKRPRARDSSLATETSSTFACGYMHVIVFFIAVYVSCHEYSRVADDILSEVQTVTHISAVTDELAATRISVRSRKYKMETNNIYYS